MPINENFLVANIERFDKVVHLLASRVSGCKEDELIAFPVILKKGTRLCHVAIGDMGCDLVPDHDFILPYVVNAAFSLELCLKMLLQCESNPWIKGHDLYELYLSVSEKSKAQMRLTFNETVKKSSVNKDISRALNAEKIQFSWNLDRLIEQSSTAYNDWRYAFEIPYQVGCFAGYYEIRGAIIAAITSIDKKSSHQHSEK
jgi:hypothetical protein